MRGFVLVGLLVVLGGCKGPGQAVMTFKEREMLQCKGQLRELGSLFGGEQVEKFQVEMAASSPRVRCASARQNTYAASLTGCVGKPVAEAVIVCGGHHHAGVGLAPDYPRWTKADGVVESPDKTVALPTGFPLPLPDDARVAETYATTQEGDVVVVFETGQDLRLLSQQYHQILNPGVENVAAERGGVLGVSGTFQGSPCGATMQLENGRVEVRYAPAYLAEQ